MTWRVKWVVLWSLWAARVVRQPTPPLMVSNGWLRGVISNTGVYKQYTGIPYATIVNKFQAPGPEPTWDGVFDAENEYSRCYQLIHSFADGVMQYFTLGQDDCLFLNVYTPLTITKPLPVIVFIHGGGYLDGSATKYVYGPEYLTSRNIVLVTVNYRLNVAGFLCLGIKEAPGNAGLKDQVAALKWIQKNIKKFGGDPDNVTLFGESAGAAAVSLHVLSPMSRGLFQKTIRNSGSSLSSWVIQDDPIASAMFKAKAVGYTSTSDDPYDLLNFFKSKTSREIVTQLTKREEGNVAQSRIVFSPCIEKHIDGVEPFLTESPYTMLSEGRFVKVPTMIGSNSEEGILFLSLEPTDYIPKVKIDVALPKNLEFPNLEEKLKVADVVKKLYMGNDEISLNAREKLSRFYGEPFFNFPVLAEADLILEASDKPLYNYYFAYDGWRNIPKFFMARGSLRSMPGAGHADELFYMFSQDYIPSMFEHRMIRVMTTLWTNFAKYGDPTPEVTELLPVRWPVVRKGDQRALVIGSEFSIAPIWYNNTTLPYWKEVYAKYRRKS